MSRDEVIKKILAELDRAETLYPQWPDDQIHAVAVMVEEAGESMQAALDCTYANGTIRHLREELTQTGAMVLRCLINLRDGI